MANEKRNNMEYALKSTLRGRIEMIANKLIWVFLITTIYTIAVHLIQFFMVRTAVEYASLEAPVQSLEFLRKFPFHISIKQFFILLYMIYAGVGFLCGIVVFVISRFRRDKLSVMGICAFVIVLPYILSIL